MSFKRLTSAANEVASWPNFARRVLRNTPSVSRTLYGIDHDPSDERSSSSMGADPRDSTHSLGYVNLQTIQGDSLYGTCKSNVIGMKKNRPSDACLSPDTDTTISHRGS